MKPTADDTIVVCISRQIRDGEVVAQGIATPLVAAGYFLAKLTHAPNLRFVSAIGQTLCREAAPLGLATVEELWIRHGLVSISFVQAACDLLPRFGPKEFFRPAQVDPWGNFNNVFIGGTHAAPRLRLPGAGGIADVTVFEENVNLYVPRHGRHTFVATLDFRSGLGHDPARRAGRGPRYLVSNLGQFDFAPEDGRLRLLTCHPGVTPRRVAAKTGFALAHSAVVPTTPPPSAEELRLLYEVIDPLGVRTLEALSGPQRRVRIREILAAERALG